MSLDDVAQADTLPDLAGMVDGCTVEAFQVDFVSWGFYEPMPWRNYWHSHSFYEVCLGYAGEGRFSHGDDEFEVRAGDVFLARPGVLHEIESSQNEPFGIAFWGFTLRPAPDLTQPGWWSGLSSGLVVSNQLGILPKVIAALAEEARRPQSGYAGLCSALGVALVIETARAFAAPTDLAVAPRRQDRSSSVVPAMHRHLVDNLARPVTVRDVAAAVHLSERHAERLFADQTGSSLMSTLRRLRLDHGGQLLLETQKTTAEVARACGYADAGAFSTAFRRHFAQPPQTFRANGGTLHLAGADSGVSPS